MGTTPADVAKLTSNGVCWRCYKGCESVQFTWDRRILPDSEGAEALNEAMEKENAVNNLADAAEQVFRVIKAFNYRKWE